MPKLHKNWKQTKKSLSVVRWKHEKAQAQAGIIQVTREDDDMYSVGMIGLNERREEILQHFSNKEYALNYARRLLKMWPDVEDYEVERPDAHDNASYMWVNERDGYEAYLALQAADAYGFEIFDVSQGRMMVSYIHNSDKMPDLLRKMRGSMRNLT